MTDQLAPPVPSVSGVDKGSSAAPIPTCDADRSVLADLVAALKVARRYVADLPIAGDADLAIVDAAILRATPTRDDQSSASEGVGS